MAGEGASSADSVLAPLDVEKSSVLPREQSDLPLPVFLIIIIESFKLLPNYVRSLSGFLFGLVVVFFMPITGMLLGQDPGDAFWGHVLRSLDWTFFLRQSPSLLLLVGIIVILLSHYLRNKLLHHQYWEQMRFAAIIFLGVVFGWVGVHLLMDFGYFRGAFILIAAAYALAILALLGFIFGLPVLRSGKKEGAVEVLPIITRYTHLSLIFICVWLILPALPAMLVIAPSPPNAPTEGYGSIPGPYEVVVESFVYPMPTDVSDIIGEVEADLDFSVYLALPVLDESEKIDQIPLAIMLHGFASPSVETYIDWIRQLSAKGVAVAFIQYPSDVHPADFENFPLIEAKGMSNHPQHFPRSLAINSGITLLQQIVSGESQSEWVGENLRNTTINPSHLWVGGHSLGAGLSFRTLDESLALGWGNESLFIALEAPYAHSVDSVLRGDISNLPAHTMAHIAISEDDTTVSPCYGVWHQQRLIGRDNSTPLNEGQILLLTIPSDRYGFPPMVASHYLQASQVHESLADWGFYRRADAQADWLVSRIEGDSEAESYAFEHLIEGELLQDMGEWSDGVDVKKISVYSNAMEDGINDHQDCREEENAFD